MRTIIVAGEPGGSIPAIRSRIETLWPGARVFDHHGMTEVGPVSYECPKRPGVLHVMESAYYAEVVDSATGKPVPAGEMGELVLTTLGRIGSPLLRCRAGDNVKADKGRQVSMWAGGNGVGRRHPGTDGRHGGCARGEHLSRRDGGDHPGGGWRGGISGTGQHGAGAGGVERAHRAASRLRRTLALVALAEKKFQANFALARATWRVPAGTLPRFEMKAKRWVRVE